MLLTEDNFPVTFEFLRKIGLEEFDADGRRILPDFVDLFENHFENSEEMHDYVVSLHSDLDFIFSFVFRLFQYSWNSLQVILLLRCWFPSMSTYTTYDALSGLMIVPRSSLGKPSFSLLVFILFFRFIQRYYLKTRQRITAAVTGDAISVLLESSFPGISSYIISSSGYNSCSASLAYFELDSLFSTIGDAHNLKFSHVFGLLELDVEVARQRAERLRVHEEFGNPHPNTVLGEKASAWFTQLVMERLSPERFHCTYVPTERWIQVRFLLVFLQTSFFFRVWMIHLLRMLGRQLSVFRMDLYLSMLLNMNLLLVLQIFLQPKISSGLMLLLLRLMNLVFLVKTAKKFLRSTSRIIMPWRLMILQIN